MQKQEVLLSSADVKTSMSLVLIVPADPLYNRFQFCSLNTVLARQVLV